MLQEHIKGEDWVSADGSSGVSSSNEICFRHNCWYHFSFFTWTKLLLQIEEIQEKNSINEIQSYHYYLKLADFPLKLNVLLEFNHEKISFQFPMKQFQEKRQKILFFKCHFFFQKKWHYIIWFQAIPCSRLSTFVIPELEGLFRTGQIKHPVLSLKTISSFVCTSKWTPKATFKAHYMGSCRQIRV